MKEQNKTPEKGLSEMKITNLSDAEFKTLVIRMFKELIRYFNSIIKTQAEMKVTLSGKKKIYGEPTVEGKKPGFKSTIWNIRKEKAFNQNIRKNKEFLKNEDRLRRLWDIFKCTNIQIIGVPEGEEEKQEIENLFEKNERKLS